MRVDETRHAEPPGQKRVSGEARVETHELGYELVGTLRDRLS